MYVVPDSPTTEIGSTRCFVVPPSLLTGTEVPVSLKYKVWFSISKFDAVTQWRPMRTICSFRLSHPGKPILIQARFLPNSESLALPNILWIASSIFWGTADKNRLCAGNVGKMNDLAL